MFGKEEQEYRFIEVLHEGNSRNGVNTIIKDRQTGVQYLFHNLGYASGFTVLVDRDGKPLIDSND